MAYCYDPKQLQPTWQLQNEGNIYFYRGDHQRAADRYKHAQRLYPDSGICCCNFTKAALCNGWYEAALFYANSCEEKYVQCYLAKAQTYEAFCRKNHDFMYYSYCVHQYECYFNEVKDATSLCQAFKLAIDFGFKISDTVMAAVKDNFQAVLRTIVQNNSCNETHLQALLKMAPQSNSVSGIAAPLSVPAVLHIKDLNPVLLNVLITHGMVITENDVRTAILILSDEQTEVLQVLINCCSSTLDYTTLWQLAIKEKPRLAKHILTYDAKPSIDAVLDIPEIKDVLPSEKQGTYDDYIWMIEHITKNCYPHERTELIGKAMENGKVVLAKRLLSGGPIDGKNIDVLHVLHLCDGNPNILKDTIKQGMTITEEDIRNAIKFSILKDKHIELLQILTKEVKDTPDYTSLWHLSIKEKPRLATHFLTCGAHPSVVDVMGKLNWKKYDDGDWLQMIECITKNCSPGERTRLVLEAIMNHKEGLIDVILSGGPIVNNAALVKQVLNTCVHLLKKLIEHGMTITAEDIQSAISVLSDEQVEVLQVLVIGCSGNLDYTTLWQLAIKEKPRLAKHILTCGAKPSVDAVLDIHVPEIDEKQGTYDDCIWMIEHLTKNCSPQERTILIGKAMENGKVVLAKRLLSGGPIDGKNIDVLHVLRLCDGNPNILKDAIKQGMTITEEDIRNAIKSSILKDEHIKLLQILTKEVKGTPDYTSLWYLSIKEKPILAKHFLKCGALPSAVDIMNKLNWKKPDDCTWMIKYITKKYSPDERTELVLKAIENHREGFIKDILSGGPIVKNATLVKQVFSIHDLNAELLKELILHGMTITTNDIKNAISILSDKQIEVLQVLTNAVRRAPDYTTLWQLAVKEKPMMAKHFLTCGAKPSVDAVIKALNWKIISDESTCNWMIEYITENCSPHERTIFVVKAIENGKTDLAKKELLAGPIVGSVINVQHVLLLREEEPSLLQHVIKQGMIITMDDISNAITYTPAILTDKHIQFLEVLTNKVKGTPDYTSLWHLSMKEKPRLATHFLTCGAHPSVVDVMGKLNWKKCNDSICMQMIEYITRNCSPGERTELVLKAIENHKEGFIKGILSGGPIVKNATLVKQVFSIHDLNAELLKELILHGMTITTNDIKNAISTFSDHQVDLLNVLTKETIDDLNYTKLFHHAYDQHKPSFAKLFFLCGAKLSIDEILRFAVQSKTPLLWMDEYTANCSPRERTMIAMKAIDNKKPEIAKHILLEGPLEGSEIDIVKVLSICEPNADILKVVITQGVDVSMEVVIKAISVLSDKQVEALQFLVHCCSGNLDYSALWQLAIKEKPRLAKHILTCGAKPSVDAVLDIHVPEIDEKQGTYDDCIWMIEHLTKNCSPQERTILIGKAMENGKVVLAKRLLSGGPIDGKNIDVLHVLHLCDGNPNILKDAIKQGMTITEEDIRNAIKSSILKDKHIELLQVLTKEVNDTPDYTSLWYLSIKKPTLAKHFLTCGAQPRVIDVMKRLNWKRFDECIWMFDYVAENCSPEERTTYVVRAIENGKNDFAEKLLTKGKLVGNVANISEVLSIQGLKPYLLKELILHGMTITTNDIKEAIKILKDPQVEVLQVITNEVKGTTNDYTALWCFAIKDKKPLLAKHLLTCGAQPSVDEAMNAINWQTFESCIWIAEYIANMCSPVERTKSVIRTVENGNEKFMNLLLSKGPLVKSEISVSHVLNIRKLTPNLLKELIAHGMTITAEDIRTAISVLSDNGIELLTILTTEIKGCFECIALSYETIKRKPKLTAHLLTCGAKPNVGDVIDFLLNRKKLDGCMAPMIKYSVENCSPNERTVFVKKAIEKNKIDLAKQVLMAGPIVGSYQSLLHVLHLYEKEPDLLMNIIKQGMTITTDDIEKSITCKPAMLTDEHVPFLEVLTDAAKDTLDFTKLWHLAINEDSPRMAKHFLKCGAKPEIDYVIKLDWKCIDSSDSMVEYVIENCSQHERTTFVVKAIENNRMDLAKQVFLTGPIVGSEIINVGTVVSFCKNEPHLIEEFIKQGMQITADDIRSVISELSDEHIQLLEVLTNELGECKEYTAMWSLAIRDKPLLAKHFLQCGAQPSVNDVIGVLNWERFEECVWMFDYIAEKCSPEERTIIIVKAIKNGKEYFAKRLLSGGPLGNISNISEVLSIQRLNPDLRLKELVAHKMTITEEGLQNAISVLTDQQVDLLSILTDHVIGSPDYVLLWYMCWTKGKTDLAKHLYRCWAQCSGMLEYDSNIDLCAMADCISKNCSPHSRSTLIVKAIKNKHECFAQQLLSGGPILGGEIDLGLLINIVAKFQLHAATSILMSLLEKGVNPNGSQKGREPIKTLLLKTDTGNSAVVSSLLRILLDVSSIDNLEFDDIQSTVIHEITKWSLATENVELIKLACSRYTFPQNGILIDQKHGRTPLHIAASSGYTQVSNEICQILCQHISLHPQDKDGNTAYQALGKNDERFKLFLKADIDRLQTKQPSYFAVTQELTTNLSSISASIDRKRNKMDGTCVDEPNKKHDTEANVLRDEAGGVKDVVQTEKDVSLDFDGLPWEVECTENVLKFLKNENSRHIKYKVVQKIHRIAQGEFHDKLCKKVSSSLQLYEAKITKAARLLWEVAIQFSPRCTGQNNSVHIFSEVIRVWSVVCDHDDIDHNIRMIEKSHFGGKNAALKIALHSSEQGGCKTHSRDRMPRKFTLKSNQVEEVVVNYVPAASLKLDEYNVVTFYSLSSGTLRCALTNENIRRDFPFKAWHEEHDIINKPYEQAIILLGRSGTGKTTCCLYRLWNEFHNYWANSCILPDHAAETKDGSIGDGATADHDGAHNNTFIPQQVCPPGHLHQVFVTRNPILCAQMKKRFYDLAAGNEHCKSHLPFEDYDLPTCLQSVEDLAYPLFLTAQQFYILLDNSLGEKSKTFFPRSADGTLNVKISNSEYNHENLGTLLDLDNSDSDGEDVILEAPSDTKGRQPNTTYVEITESYFVEHVWKNISKKTSGTLDPLLVWMEIKSIIKGSFQAVQSSNGYLTMEEYEAAGRKMAPNFIGNRSVIYELFQRYQDYIKQQRHGHLFDECDLIHHLHQYLNAPGGWYVHHFYIDEVQDFTQAELALFIRTSRDPNGLFLTGDSAQSIMQGIAFRFSDVRTIFHAAQEGTKDKKGVTKVSVPDISQLTVNFRSHSGVLNLASSIIDLLKNYFSSSFDYLPGDVGMFEGPMPVLVDTCDSGDLALLLRGNKRDKSAIEFGAHQVVIVKTEAAKRHIPDELKNAVVLSVFESKGLEFDDVLLYNFFHDSAVQKEWRVVSEFLESNRDLVKNKEEVFKQQRPLQFDELLHKSLNSELKYLYTAITRAKCNLWIYDSDDDKRLPMFEYWLKRGLVKVVGLQHKNTVDEKLFIRTSTCEEWKKQGDYFMKKCYWEPAVKCYHKAGDRHLEMEAKAWSLLSKASTDSQELYLQAALALLGSDEARHDPSKDNIRHAAKCLEKGRYHEEASQLYKLLDRHFQEFEDCSAISGCIAGEKEEKDKQSSEIGKSNVNDDSCDGYEK